MPHPRWLTLDRLMFGALTLSMLGFYLLPSFKAQANVYYAGVLAPLLLFRRGALGTILRRNGLILFSLLFIVYYGASAWWTVDDVPTRPWHKALMYMVYVTTFLAAWVYLLQHREGARFWTIFRHAMVVSGAVVGVASALVFYQTHAFPAARLEPLIHPVNLVIFGELLGFSALFALLLSYREQNRWVLGYVLLAFVACFFAMYLTHSRGPMLGFVPAFVLFLCLSRRKFLLLALVALTLGLLGYAWLNEGELLGRLASTTENQRLVIYQRIFENIRGHEWFGMGLFTDTNHPLGGWGYPHSLYLGTFYYSGVVGLVLLLGLLGFALRLAWRVYREQDDPWGLVLLTYSVFAFIFDGNKLIGHPHTLWLFIWLPIALIAARAYPRLENNG